MNLPGPLSLVDRLVPSAFLQARKVAGPFHRRRPIFTEDQNVEFPPLPAPWTDDRWFRGGFPPRRHNILRPLLHGEEYFTDLYDALSRAERRVTICGWCLTPLMPLLRDDRQHASIVADVLRDASSRAEVYVLLWCGAPALFEPTTRMVEEVRTTLLRIAPRVRCELDRTARFSHDHHQKAVTIDGRVAYVGGIDISTFQGDRWDTHEHDLRFGPNWHDAQMRLEGEIVHDVEDNFAQRWHGVTGERLEPIPPHIPRDADTPAQLVRTIPEGVYDFAPKGEFGIHHALVTAIRQAERYVYLENQYFWAPEIVDAITYAMQKPRSGPFRVVVVLPAKAYSGKYDNDHHVQILSELDAGRGVFQAFSPYAGGPAIGSTGYRYLPTYVHAKVSIVDDEWLCVGSANLNRRGIATDSEICVQSIAPDVARSLRVRLWAEHLGLTVEEVAAQDPIALIDERWRLAAQQVEEAVRTLSAPPPAKIHTYIPGHSPGSRMLDFIQDIALEH